VYKQQCRTFKARNKIENAHPVTQNTGATKKTLYFAVSWTHAYI